MYWRPPHCKSQNIPYHLRFKGITSTKIYVNYICDLDNATITNINTTNLTYSQDTHFFALITSQHWVWMLLSYIPSYYYAYRYIREIQPNHNVSYHNDLLPPRHHLSIKTVFSGVGTRMLKIRQSRDRLCSFCDLVISSIICGSMEHYHISLVFYYEWPLSSPLRRISYKTALFIQKMGTGLSQRAIYWVWLWTKTLITND